MAGTTPLHAAKWACVPHSELDVDGIMAMAERACLLSGLPPGLPRGRFTLGLIHPKSRLRACVRAKQIHRHTSQK